jgi:hypothetical protein
MLSVEHIEYKIRWNVMDRLRAGLRKNKMMIRHAAPITIESTGFERLRRNMERICLKIKERKS